jgi:hypothetical protein
MQHEQLSLFPMGTDIGLFLLFPSNLCSAMHVVKLPLSLSLFGHLRFCCARVTSNSHASYQTQFRLFPNRDDDIIDVVPPNSLALATFKLGVLPDQDT